MSEAQQKSSEKYWYAGIGILFLVGAMIFSFVLPSQPSLAQVCRATVLIDTQTQPLTDSPATVFLPRGTVVMIYNDYREYPQWATGAQIVYLALEASGGEGYILIGAVKPDVLAYNLEDCLQVIDLLPPWPVQTLEN